jgi:K+-sensing histidine kinase KdpD
VASAADSVIVMTKSVAAKPSVLVVATVAPRWVALCASIAAFFFFNVFFLPPVGTLRVADPGQWIALLTLLAVGLVASHLSSEVRRRTEEAAQRRQEAALVGRSAELKSALLAALSHDLKTPLTALTVATENLTAPWLDDEGRREQAEIVRSELARLNRLFEDVSVMAGIELQAVNADPEWVEPADIVDAAVSRVGRVIDTHQIEVRVHSAAVLVRVDPRLTSTALAHLLENAAQYSPPGSRVRIETDVVDDELRIRVTDEGPGIGPEDLERVFERHYRGADAKQVRFGSGMGLAITRGLMAAQAGRAWAERHQGDGAVFVLAVPAAVRRVQAPPEVMS